MTVIAWDGKTLAADRLACVGGLKRTAKKIFKVRDCLVGYAGDADAGEEVLAWFSNGCDPDKFPEKQRDTDRYAGLLVIEPDGTIKKYERTPYPLTYQDAQFAIGCGRDFALAAMFCGKNAIEAVQVASELDSGCGNGFDFLELAKEIEQ